MTGSELNCSIAKAKVAILDFMPMVEDVYFICKLEISNAVLVYLFIILMRSEKFVISPIFPHLFLAEDHPPGTVESHHLHRLPVSRHDTCRECLATAVCQLCTGPEVLRSATQQSKNIYKSEYLND